MSRRIPRESKSYKALEELVAGYNITVTVTEGDTHGGAETHILTMPYDVTTFLWLRGVRRVAPTSKEVA